MRKILTAGQLKIIAMIAMFIDHLGIILVRAGWPIFVCNMMRGVGRLAFPIFAFLLVEGYRHTRSVPKYIARVMLFALISEVPYDILNYRYVFYWQQSNILFTFGVALCLLYAMDKLKDKKNGQLFGIILAAVVALLTHLLGFEYSWHCVGLVVIFYMMTFDLKLMYVSAALILVADVSIIGLAAPLAIIPISMYSGQKGHFPKYLGYGFYPVHMLALGLSVIFM